MAGIYALPENPSAVDIIERSIIAHPSLFREALESQAAMHRDYMHQASNPMAIAGAKTQKDACSMCAAILQHDYMSPREMADAMCLAISTGIVALNVAGKLQCLPPHIRTAAACTLDERN